MRILLFIFLAAISFPSIFALAHDFSRYYQAQSSEFKLSAAGYYWVNLHSDSYKYASETFDPPVWQLISKILIYPGVYVFSCIALVIFLISGVVCKIFEKETHYSEHFERLDFLKNDRKSGNYKYSRRR